MSDERRGPLSRARALLERVVETVRGPRQEPSRPPPPPSSAPPASSLPPAPPTDELDPLSDPGFEGLRIDDGALVFRLGARARELGEALLGAAGTPTLRVVRVAWRETLSVETRDTHVHAEGVHTLAPLPEGAREVCAIGLSAEGRFVSLHHVHR